MVSTGMPVAEAMQLEDSLNLSLRIALVVVGVIWSLGVLGALWKMAWRPRG